MRHICLGYPEGVIRETTIVRALMNEGFFVDDEELQWLAQDDVFLQLTCKLTPYQVLMLHDLNRASMLGIAFIERYRERTYRKALSRIADAAMYFIRCRRGELLRPPMWCGWK